MPVLKWIQNHYRFGKNNNKKPGRRTARARVRQHRDAYRTLANEPLEDRTLLTIVSLTSSKDNTLIESASGSRSNGAGDVFVGWNADGDKIRRGLLAFDVAGNVPAGSTINSAALAMWVNRTQVGDRTVELHKVLADWGEAGSNGDGNGSGAQTGDATWLHTFYNSQLWTNPGGDFAPTASGSQAIGASDASYTWNSSAQMVADVQDWLDTPGNNFGWLLQGDETQRSSKRFDSRESGTASQRPTLTIDYSEPVVLPDLSINDVTMNEGDAGTTSFDFDVTLSQTSTQTVTVNYTTVDVEAVAGVDYQSNAGVVTFAPGQTSQPVSILVTGEMIVEENETFVLNLSGEVNANLVDSQGVGTVTNDDVGPVAVGDDIMGRQTISGQVWMAHSQGNAFTNIAPVETWSPTADWRDMQKGDFNGDGRDDFIGRNNNTGSWWITSLDASGTATSTKWGKWSNAVGWNDVLVGDFNNDQLDDLVGRSARNGSIWVSLSTGSSFANQRWSAWSNGVVWKDVVVGDFDDDGYDDLAGRSGSNGSWWVASSDGSSFNNARWGRWSPSKTWLDVQTGDFNNDGRTDIVGRESTSGGWWVANSNGNGFVNQKWGNWSANVAWSGVLVGDMNADGRSDIVGRSPNSGNWYVAISDGASFTTTKWGAWATSQVWQDIVIGDFNADGNDDLAGRVQSKGDWWVAVSDGTSLASQKWGKWPLVTWHAVQAGEFNN